MQKRKRVLGATIGAMLGMGLLFSPYAKLSTVYGAVTPVTINETNFPDAVFREYVKDNFDTDNNGELSVSEMENVTRIDVAETDVADLTGIENFTHLEELDCRMRYTVDGGSEGLINSLDVSQNTALSYLRCCGNQLSSLDVSKNIELEYLDCGGNQLSSLDVSKNTALRSLGCDGNQLSSLDVSKNTELEYLSCSSNQLSSLNVDQNTKLRTLQCEGNELNRLNVSQNTALRHLGCTGNKLSSLDVSQNTVLEHLSCSFNNLSSLNVGQNTVLKELWCDNNKLNSLDVGQSTGLEKLRCGFNNLCSLDVSQNTNLNNLSCNGNKISLPLYQSGSEYYIDLSSLPLDTGRVIRSSVGSYNAENGHIEGLTLNINGSSLTYQYNVEWKLP